jgi:3-oxoacyl-[acyl-carrier protein] reductase
MELQLDNKTALVTASTGGIGKEIASSLAREGARVIIRSLAELTKGTTVTVNTVMPGSTKTEGVAKLVQDIFPTVSSEEAERRFMRENRPTSLLERLIEPREIADFVTFLSSPRSSAINGAALRVDGGLVRSVF